MVVWLAWPLSRPLASPSVSPNSIIADFTPLLGQRLRA